ncbi:superoxide dismutase [Acinetobacter defluvii]|uniref:superoxide dismutase family protein n=1 Tax=Acinetobacter defluvii TaxID=1871111 RepID=UPI00148F7F29|nr:superoxide dismutase family protein [Acinetobacter defluvii]NNP72360.1 superoxide dismutase [Acinetobacter defluvii]
MLSHQILKFTALSVLLGFTTVACTTTPNTAKNTAHETVDVHAVSATGVGEKIGTIQLADSAQGLKISTDLTQLPSGFHGFHIHEKGSCEPAEKDGKMGAALAAGGHFNPNQAPGHGTPNDGHLGDLPVLNVDTEGNAKTTVYAPRLKLNDIQGLAIMVHAGGDNYSDHPKPLGGGGDRIACGVI